MKILFYRYGSICEPDVIESFKKMGLEVVEESTQITQKKIPPSQIVEKVSSLLQKDSYLFVFSINFFPAVSDICNLLNIPYVSWTVDSPIMELFSKSLSNKCNRTFMFDYAQYEYFRHANPDNIFYLPLATNVNRWESVINNASTNDISRFSADISFIGSLYSEKNPYSKIEGISDKTRGYVDGISRAQLQIYGANIIESLLNDEIMKEFTDIVPDLTNPVYKDTISPKYVMANDFIGMNIACIERHELLSLISNDHNVDIYTFSDTTKIPGIHNRGGAKTLTEMPIIFNKSKINLNMTIKPIQTGLSLRVFDVCGCGGFLLTNYQSELPEMYEIGSEVEAFASREEFVDKIDYYLSHDDERMRIAHAGYERTKKCHTYDVRMAQMIKIINSTL